jgi:hypothetical protein
MDNSNGEKHHSIQFNPLELWQREYIKDFESIPFQFPENRKEISFLSMAGIHF